MKKEDKELLLKDLSARLSYNTAVSMAEGGVDGVKWNKVELTLSLLNQIEEEDAWEFVKPYLRPLSSMTDEERHEIQEILGKDVEIPDDFIKIIDSSRKSFSLIELQAVFDFLNAHYLDFRGLIPKGLALEALDDMYNN